MVEELKVGDTLTCHTSCIISGDNRVALSVGKSYKITKIDAQGRIHIINDSNRHHIFGYRENCGVMNYEKWLYSNSKLIRKEKLEKINKIW